MKEPSKHAGLVRTAGRWAVVNAAVLPMDRKRRLKDAAVLVEDGQILALGRSGDILYDGLPVIDAAGKTLLPALADMHVHLWLEADAALFLAHGVTLVRNMSGAPFHLAIRSAVDRGELLAPRVVTTSPIIDADNFMLPMWRRLDDPAAAAQAVQEFAARGYQQIKVLNQITPEVLFALGEAGRRAGMRVTGHCPLEMTYEDAIAAGMTCFEHLVGIWRGRFLPGTAPQGPGNLALDVVEAVGKNLDESAVRRLAGQMAAQEIWNCPTLVTAREMLLPFEEGCRKMGDRLSYVPVAALPLWQVLDSNRRYQDDPSGMQRWRTALESRAAAFERVVRILAEEGAPLLAGTDTSVRFVIQGASLVDELENLVRAGLSPFEALRTATVDPARFLGQADMFGTIAPGRRADMILVDGDPLQDISALRSLSAVIVGGDFLNRAALDDMLATQKESAKKPFLDKLSYVSGETGERILIGYDGERPAARLLFRHSRGSDGTWKVTEDLSWEQPSIFEPGGVCSRLVKLRLDPEFKVLAGEILERSFAGDARADIRFDEAGDYEIYVQDVDLWKRLDVVAGGPVRVDATLAFSAPWLPGYEIMEVMLGYFSAAQQPSVRAFQQDPGEAGGRVEFDRPSGRVQWEMGSAGNVETYVNAGWRFEES